MTSSHDKDQFSRSFLYFLTIFLASYKYLMIFSKVECSEDKTMRTTKNQQNISIDKLNSKKLQKNKCIPSVPPTPSWQTLVLWY